MLRNIYSLCVEGQPDIAVTASQVRQDTTPTAMGINAKGWLGINMKSCHIKGVAKKQSSVME